MSAWLVVALCGLGTLGLRAVVPLVVGGRELPERFETTSRHVSPAMLAAVAAGVVSPVSTGGPDLALLAGAAVGGVVAHTGRHTAVALAAGFAVGVTARLAGL